MIRFNNNKQLIINKQHKLGSHEEQPLLFSLINLVLYLAGIDRMNWISEYSKDGGRL
jgi:hypothetical protein